MIKVLQLVTSFGIGGGESLVLGLTDQLRHLPVEPHVAYLRELPGTTLKPDFEHLHVPLHYINAKRLYDPNAIQRIVHYIRQNQIDLIHTHLLMADVLGRIAAKLAGIPVVSTLQNVPQGFIQFRRDRRWLERITAAYATDQLVAVSDYVRQQFIEQWHLPAKKLEVVYNAVPVERYLNTPPLSPTPNPAPILLHVGRLHPQKGQDILLQAMKQVVVAVPNARLWLVGQGEREAELRQLTDQLGLQSQVSFLGARRDIPELLSQADLFVLSSLWEGLPLAAVEAMAAARMVVLTDVGGNRELVTDRQNGLIVPPNQVDALAAALIEALTNPEQSRRLGMAARDRVRTDFSIQTIAQTYYQLYQRVLLAAASPSPQPSVAKKR